jgi:hypothetical protein
VLRLFLLVNGLEAEVGGRHERGLRRGQWLPQA